MPLTVGGVVHSSRKVLTISYSPLIRLQLRFRTRGKVRSNGVTGWEVVTCPFISDHTIHRFTAMCRWNPLVLFINMLRMPGWGQLWNEAELADASHWHFSPTDACQVGKFSFIPQVGGIFWNFYHAIESLNHQVKVAITLVARTKLFRL